MRPSLFRPGPPLLLAALLAAPLPAAPAAALLPEPPSRVVVVLEDARGPEPVLGAGAAPYLEELAHAGAVLEAPGSARASCAEAYRERSPLMQEIRNDRREL